MRLWEMALVSTFSKVLASCVRGYRRRGDLPRWQSAEMEPEERARAGVFLAFQYRKFRVSAIWTCVWHTIPRKQQGGGLIRLILMSWCRKAGSCE